MVLAGVVVSAAILLFATGCEVLLGPATRTPQQLSLLNLPVLAGSWRGTWRNTRGAAGDLLLIISAAENDRVSGTVRFLGSTCPQLASLDSTVNREKSPAPGEISVTLTADLGPPCGKLTLSLVQSRSEVPRLVGSFKNDYPESGLFAIYPR